MGQIPNNGWSWTEKCTILNLGLIKEVKAIILEINQHGMIYHTQWKSRQMASPHFEE